MADELLSRGEPDDQELRCSKAALLAANETLKSAVEDSATLRPSPPEEGGLGGLSSASQLLGGASVKEATLRLGDIRRSKREFEHRLSKCLDEAGRLEMQEPDKVLQWIVDISQLTQSKRLKLKNLELIHQEKQLKQQFKRKREQRRMKELEQMVPSERDNGQMIVTNPDKLQAKNFKVHCLLRSDQEQLKIWMQESIELDKDISSMKHMLGKIEEEIQHAEQEILKEMALNQCLHRHLTIYQAPYIIEYMRVKTEHKKLQQGIHTWQGKARIVQMTPKTLGTFRPRELQNLVKLPYTAAHRS